METSLLNIQKPGNRLEVQKSIVNAAIGLLSADWSAVVTLNPITRNFVGRCVANDELSERAVKAVQPWLETVASREMNGRGVGAEGLSSPPDVLIGDFNLKDTAFVKTLIIHIKGEQAPLAVLHIGFRQPRQFSPEEETALSALVAQSASALENIWLLGRYQAVISIGQKLNRKLHGYRELFEELREEVANIIDTSYFFMLAVYQPQGETLDYYFSTNKGKTVVQLGAGLGGIGEAVIKKGQTFKSFYLSRDSGWDVAHVDLLSTEEPNPESLIFVPLNFRGEALGVLTVQHTRPHAFDEEDVQILSLLSNQVALALNTVRLFNYLETLNEVGQRLTENLSSTDLLKNVVDKVRAATYADVVTLYPYLSPEGRFGHPVYSGDLRNPEFLESTMRADDIARLTLKRNAPVWATDSAELYGMLGGDPKKREGNFETREGISSTVALGLRIGEKAVGVLFIAYRRPQRFNASQRQLITGLANYAAIAIKSSREFHSLTQRRFEELLTLRELDREISQTLELGQILEAILRGATERVRADSAMVLLYDPRTDKLEAKAYIGPHAASYRGISFPPDEGGNIPVLAFTQKRSIRIDNVRTDPAWRQSYFEIHADIVSEMCVPLFDGDKVIGVLNLESNREAAFTRDDEEFLITLASQAVRAIVNAQVFESAVSAHRGLKSLHEVSKEIITQHGDPERVMKLILASARRLIGAEMGALQLYVGERPGKCYLDWQDSQTRENVSKVINTLATGDYIDLGIINHSALTRLPYITLTDAQSDPFYRGSADVHSEVAVPLIARDGDLIGVLTLQSPRLYAFDNYDLETLDMFARQAAIAIQNAQAYSLALAESARFRLLSEVGRDLGELTEIGQVEKAYDIVLQKVEEFSDAQIILRTFDEATEDLVLERVLNQRRTPPQARISKYEGVNGQVARERRAIVIDDLSHIPEGVATPIGGENIRTLAVIPIQFKTRYYGNLVLSHETAYSLSSADILLLQGLAQQLAITLYRLEIVQAKQKAEQQAQSLGMIGELGQSTYELTHRLGNSLGIVRPLLNNVRRELEASSIKNDAINEDLERIATNVFDVLSLSMGLKRKVSELGERGSFTQGRITVRVRALLEDAIRTPSIPENVHVAWEIADDLAEVNVVPGQIADILHNLFLNAIEAMPDGGSMIIRSLNVPPNVRIEVEDTGPGIPLSYRSKIFNLFFSTKNSSGFGLWSARRYARANGGDLTLESQPGKGSTFILDLPMARGEET